MASNIYIGITITVSDSPLILLCLFFDSHYIKIRSAVKKRFGFLYRKAGGSERVRRLFAFFVVK